MANSPSITVVIPCYNGAEFLRETLHSALSQTLRPQEILVIDDGSTDDSAAIAEAFGSPVRVILQENQGESVARNKGFELASGQWIALLDADDRWLPEKLWEQARLIEPGVVCVHTPYRTFGESAGLNDRSHVPPAVRYTPEYVAVHPFITPSSMLIRRDVQARFPTWTRYGEDGLFCLDLLREGSFRMTTAPLTEIRRHRANQSGKRAIEIEWHKSILGWLEQHRAELSAATCAQIERGWRGRLVRAAWLAWRRGDRPEYEIYRQYIQERGPFYRPFCRLGLSHAWRGLKSTFKKPVG